MVDWALATKIAGAGFGIVFLVLIILAMVLWGVSRLIQSLRRGKEGQAQQPRGK